jgi:hypothetical protein
MLYMISRLFINIKKADDFLHIQNMKTFSADLYAVDFLKMFILFCLGAYTALLVGWFSSKTTITYNVARFHSYLCLKLELLWANSYKLITTPVLTYSYNLKRRCCNHGIMCVCPQIQCTYILTCFFFFFFFIFIFMSNQQISLNT